MQAEYIFFYLEGRDARLLRNAIDADKLAEQIAAGKGSVYEVVHAAASDAGKEIRSERHKVKFGSEYEDEIKDAGGDVQLAYDHFVDGKVDELCFSLQPDVIEALGDLGGEEGEDDEDEDDEDEDEDPDDDDAK